MILEVVRTMKAIFANTKPLHNIPGKIDHLDHPVILFSTYRSCL